MRMIEKVITTSLLFAETVYLSLCWAIFRVSLVSVLCDLNSIWLLHVVDAQSLCNFTINFKLNLSTSSHSLHKPWNLTTYMDLHELEEIKWPLTILSFLHEISLFSHFSWIFVFLSFYVKFDHFVLLY